ncbi:hypothetical protein M407DRAFT_214407 [Tulasnella calospora MUT 4182]|uniref:Uncharacterized protein n=1 Tax=Tulasnella calospora MUT 4182 TaxID=1051891 RepID=A0A0C3KQA7_9AGAM|nr:hypothetical protein M407DRAFT_214407 [Tulasnella calospora MUT 4182]
MPRHGSETLRSSASNIISHTDTTVGGGPLDIPRKSRPLESRSQGVRIAGPVVVSHPHEASIHAVAPWDDQVMPGGHCASSSSLNGSFPYFFPGYGIPILRTSLHDIGGAEIGRPSMNDIGISWPSSSPFFEGSPSTTSESRSTFQTLSTSYFSNHHSPTSLRESSAESALPPVDHLGYLRVPRYDVRRHNFASSEVSRSTGGIPAERTADDGNITTNSTKRRLSTTAPALDLLVAPETRAPLVTSRSPDRSVLAAHKSLRSLLSLTRPQPSVQAVVRQPMTQTSISALSPSIDSVCNSSWSVGSSSISRGVISPGPLNLELTIHGPIDDISRQRSSPSSASHQTTNIPLSSVHTLHFNPSTWPMVAENRFEPKREQSIPTEDVVTNYTMLMAANNSQKRSLVQDMRLNTRGASSKAPPRSSLPLHPDSEAHPATEFGAKTTNNSIGIANPEAPCSINPPARGTGGISLGLVPPITRITRRTGLVSSLGQHSIHPHDASRDAETTLHGFEYFFDEPAIGKPTILGGNQGSQTNSSGHRDYITQTSSESYDNPLQAAMPFNADQSRGAAFPSFPVPYGIPSGREFSGIYQTVKLSATPEPAASRCHGGEPYREVQHDRSVPSRVALLKSPANGATSEPRASQYTATPEFSYSPASNYPAESSAGCQRDQPSSEQRDFATLAENIKRILETEYHRGETTDWCILYSGVIRRMRTRVSTRGEIAAAMTRCLAPPIPEGFADYLKEAE